jgi:drug/metabolite transporter (DMT)-like permease
MRQRTANLLLLLAGAIWGMGFIAQSTAMEHIGPMLFMVLRFTLAAAAVWMFAVRETRRKNHPSLSSSELRKVLILGVVFWIPMTLQQVGLLVATVTNAGFLTGLYVVIVPFIVFLGLRERQHWIVWPGAGMALLGTFLLGDGGFGGLIWGDWLIALSAIFAAIHIVLLGKTVQRTGRPVLVATLQFAVSAVLSLIGFIIFRLVAATAAIEPAITIDRVAAAAPQVLFGGLIAGGLAFTLMAVGQRYTKQAHAAILISSEALFAALLGALILGERLSTRGYAGIAVMFTAILMVQAVPLLKGRKLQELHSARGVLPS